MKKLIVSLLILATVMFCFTLSIAAAPSATHTSDEGRLPFEDVKSSHWFYDSLEFCYANGIIKGMNDYTFGFSGNLTRAQFVTMLAGLEGVDTSTYTVTKFTDVKSSHWYYGAVAWAYTEGIVNGMTETTFAPNASLTRAQLATIMRSYMEDKYEVEVKENALDGFTDKPKESYWYFDAMKYTVSAGLLSGNSDGTLASTGTVTRAQAVVILKSFMEKYFYGSCEHLFSEADCTNSAVCEKCGLVNGLPKGHRIVAYNCVTADNCLDCGAEVAPSNIAHAFNAATCTEPGTCSSCGATRGEAKGHSWKAATCTSPKTCTVCKLTEGTTLSANGQHSWWLATCKNPKMCKVCYTTEGKALGHKWVRADCVNPKRCTRCKLTEGSPITTNKQHTWWSATCTNPKMCRVCYVTSGEKLGHNWVGPDCLNPRTCTRCKQTVGSAVTSGKPHVWWAATCVNPKMCKVCYKTEGDALGHIWKNADCIAPKTCTRCKVTDGKALSTTKQHTWWAATCKNPKMCKVCYKTEGNALGHIWKAADCLNPKTCTRKGCGYTEGSSMGHNWIAATCYKEKHCSRCDTTEGRPLGHTTLNGVCTRCSNKINATGFNKVISIIKQNGRHYPSSDYYDFLMLDDFNYTKLEYKADLNMLFIIYRNYYEDGSYANGGISMVGGESVYEYYYNYHKDGGPVFYGNILLNSTTLTKDFREGFSKYNGVLKKEYTDYMNSDLDKVLGDINAMLEPYGVSINDIGFKAY